MPVPTARLVLLLVLLAPPGPAAASEWGGIEPGVSTVEQVRERHGPPSKETRSKLEGYDTLQWVYEGNRAPTGFIKMTVDFGILTAGGYKPAIVRIFALEPKAHIFGRNTVIQGWGLPDGLHKNQDGTTTLVWKDGLLVTFDKEDQNAVSMIFSVPQPMAIGGGAPAAPTKPAAPGPPAPAPSR